MVNAEDNKKSILTEAEIAALADVFDTPSLSDDGEFRRYNFELDQSLRLAQWDVLNTLMVDQAGALKAALNDACLLDLNVEFCSSGHVLAKDFEASMPESGLLISAEIRPFTGRSYLSIDADLTAYLVDQSLGGYGAQPKPVRGRLMPIERRMGERIARSFFGIMKAVWAKHLSLSIDDLDADTPIRQLLLDPNEAGFASFSYAFSVGVRKISEVCLLLPFASLASNADQIMSRQPVKINPTQEINRDSDLYRRLPDIPLEVAGVLLSRTISIRELLAIQLGAVIPIDSRMQINLSTSGRCIAMGHYEVGGGMRVCRIVEPEGRQ